VVARAIDHARSQSLALLARHVRIE